MSGLLADPHRLVKFVLYLVFREYILEYGVRNEVQIQAERVSPWVTTLLLNLLGIWDDHTIVGSKGVGDTRAKGLGEDSVVRCQNATFIVHIELGRGDSLTQSYLLAFEVLNGYLVSLISASPYYYISVLQMWSLSL